MGPNSLDRTLVFGTSGQVGSALLGCLGEQGIGIDEKTGDFLNPASLVAILDSQWKAHGFTQVINAAAYTAVDLAEKEEDKARLINAVAPGVIAQWCAEHGVPFVHYSTDYVFEGSGVTPWRESDPTGPLSAYGRTKLEGEQRVQEAVSKAGGKFLIFRTSWVYDAFGKNFFRTMVKLAKEKSELRIVADQWGAPTYAPHLARATLTALSNADACAQFPSGIYHLCNQGSTNWFEFAKAIFATARQKGEPLALERVLPLKTCEYPTPAKRPLNSRLDLTKAREKLGLTLPSWQTGLEECCNTFWRTPT
ncbi:dTDP-4-dehydrorhamnose reductase [Bdellovibrionota bacterium FG-2]